MATKQLKLYFWDDTLNVVGGKWGTAGFMFALAYSKREARTLLKKQLKSNGQWCKIAEKDLDMQPNVITAPYSDYKVGQDGG